MLTRNSGPCHDLQEDFGSGVDLRKNVFSIKSLNTTAQGSVIFLLHAPLLLTAMATAHKAPICTICGVKLGHTSLESEDITPGWYPKISTQGSVLLSGPHWPWYGNGPVSLKIPDSAVGRHAADLTNPPPMMRILSTEESMFPQEEMDCLEADRRDPSASQILYVGIHTSCENMANRAMQSSPICEIRSIGDLWMTLERRCTGTIRSRRLTLSFLPIIFKKCTWQGVELGLERYFIPPEFFDQSEENRPVAEQEWVSTPV